jgi:hypothetical protein
MSHHGTTRSASTNVLKLLFLIVYGAVTAVAAWITAIKMRRRIKRALGSEASKGQLTSIATWMKVDEAEERKLGGKLPNAQ